MVYKEISVAYFSMEIGLQNEVPSYAGGLGILAGDTLRSFADLGIPAAGVTLLYKKGNFRQKINNYRQIEEEVRWQPEKFMKLLPTKINLHIEGRDVLVQAWKYELNGTKGKLPIFFLDTDLAKNDDYDRELTHFLYGKDEKYRLAQEVILGIGGTRMLSSIGINPKRYHMNEGHASLLAIELLKKSKMPVEKTWDETKGWDPEVVKEACVFTTHTPVETGHDKFSYDLVSKVLKDYIPIEVLKQYGGNDKLNMTLLALNLSNYVNGVAKRHKEISQNMFPGYNIESITNGVHVNFWLSKHFSDLFNKYIPGWENDPFSLRYALGIPDLEIKNAHLKAKNELISYIKEKSGIEFKQDVLTMGYARRFTGYKRPDLIFSDTKRLEQIAEKNGGIQLVFAGKAHPKDENGKNLMEKIIKTSEQLTKSGKVKAVFLEDYNIKIANKMVSGCDIWLNNPQRPLEASGTSGMKAAVNGVPQISTLDGWWLEGHIENVTGWSIGPGQKQPGFDKDYDMKDEADDLYNKLENIVLPLYYKNHDALISIRKNAIAINGSFFNTHRMAQQYVSHSYF